MSVIAQLLSSKKFLATLASILVWVLGRAGLNISEDALLPVIASLAAFVLAQGWADHGKEAVKEASRAEAAKLSGPLKP